MPTADLRLADRAAINDVIVALARAQDDRNWEVITEIFDREVVLDLPGHLDGPPRTVSPRELADGMRQTLAGFDWTEHTTSNVVIEFEGDQARCRTYVHAYHRLEDARGPEKFCSMRGRWDQRFARIGDRWLIRS